MGPLAIFRDALQSLASSHGDRFDIVALVHRRDLFDVDGVTFLEFPRIASSWLARLWFEYWSSNKISRRLKPSLWLSMHDVTPNVTADVRAVYCHQSAAFYRPRTFELFADPKIVVFSLFYGLLYRIHIHENDYVIVQQNWMREEFRRRYGVRHVVVAHPSVDLPKTLSASGRSPSPRPYRFFYPAAPRTFKNPEVCLQAARLLEQRNFTDFELWLTFDASTNRYASTLAKQFGDVRSVRWLGSLSRERVFELYAEADCLLFPSLMETWGLPITEFRALGKPMLVADMPYASETAAGYDFAKLFDPADAGNLADLMVQAANGEPIFRKLPEAAIDPPYARNWMELWELLLNDHRHA